MSELKGACIIGQSGGPTAVINASAQGVIETALKSGCITQVLGAAHGIKGVLADQLYDMGKEDSRELALLKYTPSSALGSCRYKLADPDEDDTDYKRILEIFQKHDVRYFFYNGGNDSMDTCNKISKYMQKVGYECRIMGVPKTIDNDLNGTDHCPGFASAAKYIATSCMEVWQDAHVYDTGMVTIIEIMGRHAGWLAGSAALATIDGLWPRPRLSARDGLRHGPVHRRCQGASMTRPASAWSPCPRVSTTPTAPSSPRPRPPPPTASATLSWAVWRHHAGRRGQADDWAPRSAASSCPCFSAAAPTCASKTDIEEAYHGRPGRRGGRCGRRDRQDGGLQVQPVDGGYHCKTKLWSRWTIVANFEKKVPREWINEAGNGVNQAFIDYALPLDPGR